jgi:hypothetical protein
LKGNEKVFAGEKVRMQNLDQREAQVRAKYMGGPQNERTSLHVQTVPLKETLKDHLPSLNIKRNGFVQDKDIYELNKLKNRIFPKLDYEYIRQALKSEKPNIKDLEVTERDRTYNRKLIAQTYRDEMKQERMYQKGDEVRLTDVPSIRKYMTAAKDMIHKIKNDEADEIDSGLKERLLNAKEYKLNLPEYSMRPLKDE